MSFPAGPLPNSSQLSNSFVPVVSVAFPGGADMDLTNPAVWAGAPCAVEIYCTTSGSILAVLAGDAAGPTVQTYPVVAGQVLQGNFVLIKAASVACIARR